MEMQQRLAEQCLACFRKSCLQKWLLVCFPIRDAQSSLISLFFVTCLQCAATDVQQLMCFFLAHECFLFSFVNALSLYKVRKLLRHAGVTICTTAGM